MEWSMDEHDSTYENVAEYLIALDKYQEGRATTDQINQWKTSGK